MVAKYWIRIPAFFLALATLGAAAPGDDVVAAFARANRGASLRYVAIGGSITEASGPGWIGDWLRESFPESRVVAINSGMSGTGSSLGVFRVERDVLAHQPDLVAIEYCVNDGGVPDEDAIRYLESMIVRVKTSPHPPAIVILAAAARTGVNLSRHRRVARHYDLLEVDFQAAVDAKLAAEKSPWSELFGDDVHPKRAGHAFYAEVFRDALAPLARRARTPVSVQAAGGAASVILPAPLSAKPLLLDARLAPLQSRRESGDDWRAEPAPSASWGRHFQGLLGAERPGAALQIPFRGTAAGVFFPLKKGNGSFFLNVDGRTPMQVFANTRDGFSSVVVENDLPSGEHVLNVVLPRDVSTDPDFKTEGPVQLGYLLVAGETLPLSADNAIAGARAARKEAFDADTLSRLRFETIPASAWEWAGPFPVPTLPDGRAPADAIGAIAQPFLPALERAPHTAADIAWQPLPAPSGGRMDLRAASGSTAPAVAYARCEWVAEKAGPALLWVEVDYYAQLWLNGERILSLEGPHRTPVLLPVKLHAGRNAFLLKLGAGSAGFSARLRVAHLD